MMRTALSLVVFALVGCRKPAPVEYPQPAPAPVAHTPAPRIEVEPPPPRSPFPAAHWVALQLDTPAVNVVRGGDIDGDGKDDLLIGTPQDAGGGTIAVLFGATLTSTPDGGRPVPDRVIHALGPADRLGEGVVGLGDLDGDGLGEILVGAPAHDAAGRGEGGAWLLLGRTVRDHAEPALTDAWTFFQGARRDRIGVIAALGDLDGDGRTEVLFTGRTRAYLLRGAELTAYESFYLPDAGTTVVGTAEESALFEPIAVPAGDTLGNGWGGALIGLPDASGPMWLMHGVQLDQGRFVDLRANPWARFVAPGPFLVGGFTAADLDGDGRPEPIVGWHRDRYVLSALDAGYLLQPGSYDLGTQATRTIESTAAFAIANVAALGDLDGDGLDEVAIGTRMERGAPHARACVFRGATLRDRTRASLDDCDALLDYPVDHQGYWWTTTVTAAGDLDGDGIGDLVVTLVGRGWDDPERTSEIRVVVHRSPWTWAPR